MLYVIATLVTIVAFAGILLTLLTLPGTWVALAAAALAQWWSFEYLDDPATPDTELMFSWWSLGGALFAAVLGEVIEFVASAVGAAKAGGGKRAAILSMVGGFVGAIVGTLVPPPIVGTILGAAVGAGLGGLAGEKLTKDRTWSDSSRVGLGAATGRLVATIAKAACAAVIFLILAVDAFV